MMIYAGVPDTVIDECAKHIIETVTHNGELAQSELFDARFLGRKYLVPFPFNIQFEAWVEDTESGRELRVGLDMSRPNQRVSVVTIADYEEGSFPEFSNDIIMTSPSNNYLYGESVIQQSSIDYLNGDGLYDDDYSFGDRAKIGHIKFAVYLLNKVVQLLDAEFRS